jgi:heme exporter protein B
MMRVFYAVLLRDVTLAMRYRTDVLTALFFFLIVVSLFPLAIGAEKATLRLIAPGVIWVAALLASLLALERLFADDFADGSLEQMLLIPQPLVIIVLAKICAHWLLTGLPLTIIAPLIGLQYHLLPDEQWIMMLTLVLGTPVLSLIGAIGAALTLGLRGGGVLVALLILPLYIPVLVYGAGAVAKTMLGVTDVSAYFELLSAFLILALVLSPWATAAALRVSSE